MASDRDEILRGVLDHHAVRVVAALTTRTGREAARRHRAAAGAAAALGRAATAGLLLATLTKGEERVTLQILGDGPLGAITVDATARGTARAFLKHPEVPVPARPGARVALGRFVGARGLVGVVRDLGMRENFSGQTLLVDGELDTDVEHYLMTSEQIESALGCEALLDPSQDLDVAGGVLVQSLPGSEGAPLVAEVRERLRRGSLAEILGGPAPPATAEALARAVLGEEGAALRVLDTRAVAFHCPCSRDRASSTLMLVGRGGLDELLEEDGGATVVCDFCRESYAFTPADIEEIRAAIEASPRA